MVDFKNIKGFDELQNMLDSLPAKLEANVMRGALRQGANVIKAEAQQNLVSNGNVKTEELSRGLKVSTRLKGGKVTASVKAKGKHGYIARWIEFTGAAPHIIKGKNGKALAFAGGVYKAINHPGFKPKPFMRPALDGKASAALVAVGEAIKKRLTKQGLNAADIDIEVEE
jgi:HK97 gp10 family phage protein